MTALGPAHFERKVASAMQTLRLRVASLEDAKRLYDWSCALSPEAPTPWGQPVWDDHLDWLALTLGPMDQLLFIGEAVRTDQAIGAVRFDQLEPTLWSVAIVVAPEFRGRGWSRKLLQAGLDHFDGPAFIARIPRGDLAAAALFRNVGFGLEAATGGLDLYRRAAAINETDPA